MSDLQVLNYLNSFSNYEKNPRYSEQKPFKLSRIKNFLTLIGSPQKSLSILHIAGTKGKGSTCAFLAHILSAAGFSVGLYTSPHLHDFRERIRIIAPGIRPNSAAGKDFSGMISWESLSQIVKELQPVIRRYNLKFKSDKLSFFEVYTAIAFLYFLRRGVDFVVLETGMGGRLDATNTAWPLVCGITPISLEHTQILGKTLAKIAREKAGIIKNRTIVVSAPQEPAVEKIIVKRCKQFSAKLLKVGKQIKCFQTKQGLVIKGLRNEYKNLKLTLLGRHQLTNAALAVGLAESLYDYGFKIAPDAIRRGLAQTVWPGRCEVIQKNPWVVLDGAQNLASALTLRSAIKDNFSAIKHGGSAKVCGGKYQKLILVLGVSADKDLSGICKILNPLADVVILTCAKTLRATAPAKLASYFKRKVYLTSGVKKAKILASRLAGKKDLILVTGSLFVVGEFRDEKK